MEDQELGGRCITLWKGVYWNWSEQKETNRFFMAPKKTSKGVREEEERGDSSSLMESLKALIVNELKNTEERINQNNGDWEKQQGNKLEGRGKKLKDKLNNNMTKAEASITSLDECKHNVRDLEEKYSQVQERGFKKNPKDHLGRNSSSWMLQNCRLNWRKSKTTIELNI